MEKKDIKKLVIVFVVVFFIGLALDLYQSMENKVATITRQEIGEDTTEEELTVSIEGIDGIFDYTAEIEAMLPTQEQAEQYFEKAIMEIDLEFSGLNFSEGCEKLPMKKEYVNGTVAAKWSVDPWEVVKTDGTIVYEEIATDGQAVGVSVNLLCGNYEKTYQFPIRIIPREKSQEELVMEALNHWMQYEMEKEGSGTIVLPQELLGRRVYWTKERSNIAIEVLLIEVIAVILVVVLKKQENRKRNQERAQKLEFEYPEVVGQLELLLGAGMNLRQAWNIIATRYLDNRQNNLSKEKEVYEGIVKMMRRVEEGENEKKAYQRFANELQNSYFHRLMRHLAGNLEKGTQGLCIILEQESKQAYEHRILQSKRLGEEASTKMLVPLMLMMVVVMVIVIAPAMIDFTA